MSKDPVCGMSVADDSAYQSRFAGHDYAFCSEDCKTKFDQAPEDFATSVGASSGRSVDDDS